MDRDGTNRFVLNGRWDSRMEACEVLNEKGSEKGGKPTFELGPPKELWLRRAPP